MNSDLQKAISHFERGLACLYKLQDQIEQPEENECSSGRPLKSDVPQEKVEKIVSDLIADPQNKRFVHQNGRYEGRANLNQICKYIEENHAQLFNRFESKRNWLRRIKRALPDDMT